ncbi:uncharacterized protein LOC134726356 [Mytilus trossulus]|uniref:uncharacterized protein LOC134726356 n=1 Tax=Mytilus trossulus TaxID=6551 RepID=UPI00300607CD
MTLKTIWTILCVFSFLPWKVKTDNGMFMTTRRRNWIDSLSYCSLVSENNLHYLYNKEYAGWAGGIYLNTQWMIHHGCYSKSGAMNSNDVHDIKRLSPQLCSEKCKILPYFALKTCVMEAGEYVDVFLSHSPAL